MSVWDELTMRAGRNDYPYLLGNAVLVERTITDLDEIAGALATAWCSPEYPEQSVDPALWQMMFDMTGFVEDGQRIDNPVTGAITLYRGAAENRKAGMSWTADVEKAKWFASRFAALTGERDVEPGGTEKMWTAGKVWTITVFSEWVIGHFTDRNEDEWVIAMTDELAEEIREADL